MMRADLVVIGAGAAGLAAAIHAGEADADRRLRIVVLERAPRIGAKILVSGGGRCNVTNITVTENDYWGTSPAIVRSILKSFDVAATLRWFRRLGVDLVAEPSGKYFPSTNRSVTVRDALVRRARQLLGEDLVVGARVLGLDRSSEGFVVAVEGWPHQLKARRVIVATGGKALPKSGSDGAAYAWLQTWGHTIVPPVPALVPLVLQRDDSLGGRFGEFAGISFPARLCLRGVRGERIAQTIGSLLWTHFGLSGPAVLDLSRHVSYELEAHGPPVRVTIGHQRFACRDEAVSYLEHGRRSHARRTVKNLLTELFPARFAEALAGEWAEKRLAELSRAGVLQLAERMTSLEVAVCATRGFAFAEVTAGGVDLREIDRRTLESRLVPGLHLCGEILDADGRIGGFNFQWAWATGFLAGRGAAQLLLTEPVEPPGQNVMPHK